MSPDKTRRSALDRPTVERDALEYDVREDVVLVLDTMDPRDPIRDLRRRVPPLLDAPPPALVVDLSCLTALSSGAVAVLLWLRETCQSRGVDVRLRHLPRGGGATLRRTGLADTLLVEASSR
ncbi:STAS domain-containing protein [Nocardioides sediminis]|uniref:STAS domain-containing protein n=1 Tax=Nocardioides sediminis TaxID=433648 RepID=UPI000D327A52|nr:STAS domain-containing protein [Nocardioides sediminis]